MLDWLAAYAAHAPDLDSIRALPVIAADVLLEIIPGFDGEEDPFPLDRLDDLALLPELEQLTCTGETLDVEPILAHPKLRRVVVHAPEPKQKKYARALGELEAGGFAAVSSTGPHGWITLARGVAGVPLRVLAALERLLPKLTSRKGRVVRRVELRGVAVEEGALLVTLETTVYDADGAISRDEVGSVRLLEPADRAADEVLHRLKARVDALARPDA